MQSWFVVHAHQAGGLRRSEQSRTRSIGINTLVAGQAEPGVQAQGIGFAIAIDTAKPIADQLV
jgi:hypothetical protein